MFKFFFIYPIVLLILFWLVSDVHIGASVYRFEDNYISVEFPKMGFRSEEHPEPWLTFYWNAESTRDGLNQIKDAVVE